MDQTTNGIFRAFRTAEEVARDALRELHEANDCDWESCPICIEESLKDYREHNED